MNTSGAAGNFVSALLQTAGLYSQSQVIATFHDFFTYMGVLIYIIAAIGGFISFAVFGNYRQVIYFLIGPALFFFMIYTTVEVERTAYKYGTRLEVETTEDLVETLRETADKEEYSRPARVSWFYYRFDNLTSYVTQRLVSVFVDTENSQDKINHAREHAMQRLLKMRASDPLYVRLFSVYVFGDCARYMKKEADLANEGNAIQFGAGGLGVQQALNQDLKAEFEKQKTVKLEDEIVDYLNTLGVAVDSELHTCEELWNYLFQVTQLYAESSFDPTTNQLKMFNGVDWDRVEAEVRERLAKDTAIASGLTGPEVARDVLAIHIIKNTMMYTAHGQLVSGLTGRGDWHQEGSNVAASDAAAIEITTFLSEMKFFSNSLPYWQGIILYFLSLSFPFFAMMLLIPGRYSGFFIWCSLWMWVKSWDVAFAVLHVVRDRLWEVMPSLYGSKFTGNIANIDFTQPAEVLFKYNEVDPTNSYSNYLSIMSFLMLGVPMITAQMFKGAQRVFQALREGLGGGAAEEFGGNMGRGAGRNYADANEVALQGGIAQQTASGADKAAQNIEK